MSAAANMEPHFETEACSCKCNCAGCYCNRRASHDIKGMEAESDYIILDGSGSSVDGFPQGEEGPGRYPPAFPWRGNGAEEHVDNPFGGFEITQDGFQHSGSDDGEPLRQSMILRDLTAFNRTGTPTSLMNEATSGVASMKSSGFLPRRPDPAQNILDFVGSWDETSPGPGYHFTGQPLWLSPSRWSQRYDSGNLGYPKGIRDEDMK